MSEPRVIFKTATKKYCKFCQQITIQYRFSDDKIRCNRCGKIVEKENEDDNS